MFCQLASQFLNVSFHGGTYQLNDHLWEGKYSPRDAHGKRISRNVYAKTCEECEEKLAVMIEQVKKEIAAEKEKQQASQEEQEAFLDNVIMYEVLSELKEIAARPNGITCACGSSGYGMDIRRSAVDLVCRTCGAKLRIPAATDRDLDDLCCHIKLVIPGRNA